MSKVRLVILGGCIAAQVIGKNGEKVGLEARHTAGTDSGEFDVPSGGHLEVRELSQAQFDNPEAARTLDTPVPGAVGSGVNTTGSGQRPNPPK